MAKFLQKHHVCIFNKKKYRKNTLHDLAFLENTKTNF